MTTKNKLEQNKELVKALSKVSHYDLDNFIQDAKNYINAIRTGRMLCIIESVSKSGMSRVIKFHSCEKGKNRYWYRQYRAFFIVLGYSEVKNSDGFRINGCGMDMVFHTNYTIIHNLYRLGLLSKSECEKLAQETPTKL